MQADYEKTKEMMKEASKIKGMRGSEREREEPSNIKAIKEGSNIKSTSITMIKRRQARSKAIESVCREIEREEARPMTGNASSSYSHRVFSKIKRNNVSHSQASVSPYTQKQRV